MAAAMRASVFKEQTVFFASFLIVPALMVATKSLRMQARDEHEVIMDVRYKAVFWERGSEFSRALGETLMNEIVEARRKEIAEAMMLEEEEEQRRRKREGEEDPSSVAGSDNGNTKKSAGGWLW